ncbi:MAG: hypothetical protein AAF502_21180 [Bacteroidota bacterium]
MSRKTTGSIILIAIALTIGYFVLKFLTSPVAFLFSTFQLVISIVIVVFIVIGVKRLLRWMNG